MRIKEIEILGEKEALVNINLILGANNTGKSTFLKELEFTISNGDIQNDPKWISTLEVESSGLKSKFDNLFPGISYLPTSEEAVKEITRDGKSAIFGNPDWNDHIFQGINQKGDGLINYKILAGTPRDADWHYLKFFYKLSVAIENCDSRLAGPFSTHIKRINDPYNNIVHYLYSETAVFKKISDHIKQVFGIDILFDNLAQGQKDIRLALDAPVVTFATSKEESDFWEKHSPILQTQGDGLKAYLKILYCLFNPAKEVIIIDEPEAFLHSPQRRSLGKFIADNASNGKQIFIATHDSEFLRGLITNVTVPTQVVYLKNNSGVREYTINKIIPVTRSRTYNESFLNSYFNKLTILCEGEDDRMIYQYASQVFITNEAVDIHFIGLNGKREVVTAFKELQLLKINTAIIVDIDILYSGECIGFVSDPADKLFLQNIRTKLNALQPQEKIDFKKDGVSSTHVQSFKVDIESAIKIAKKYHIHILHIGELESWLDNPATSLRIVQAMKNEIDVPSALPKKAQLKNFLKGVIL